MGNRKLMFLMGEISCLMIKSKIHRFYSLEDMADFVAPGIELNQFRIYRNKHRLPVGYISWAKLSDEIKNKFLYEKYILKPQDWKTGTNLIFVDFVAPFGHAKKIIKDLRNNIFLNETAEYLRFSNIGQLKGVRKVKNINGF